MVGQTCAEEIIDDNGFGVGVGFRFRLGFGFGSSLREASIFVQPLAKMETKFGNKERQGKVNPFCSVTREKKRRRFRVTLPTLVLININKFLNI